HYAWKVWDHWERHLDPEALTASNLRAVLEDRVVLVTGASSGIGRAVAAHVARHGAKVMLVSRTRQKLDELKAEIEAEGGRAWVYATDLSNLDACERMGRQVLEEHGQVDVLVNNAGRSIRRSLVQQLDRFHDFERTMQLNYFGAVKLMLTVVPGMRERRSGHVINISAIGVPAGGHEGGGHRGGSGGGLGGGGGRGLVHSGRPFLERGGRRAAWERARHAPPRRCPSR